MAARWYGRAIGLLSGLVLATMWEFYTYASDAEADMFLCAIVTAAIAVFVWLEFREDAGRDEEPVGFLGRRPWPVLAFFILCGMTNLAKGLIFGTLMVLVPITCYLIWNFDLRAVRRYVWLWGWLAFAAVSFAWPALICRKYPDAIELWASDYVGRLNQGFIREPAWYYLVTLPWVMLPWTVLAVMGLWQTARSAFRQRYSPERFLWCWAVLTPAVFSIPQGKHHHYLLQCLAPWAVFTALAAVRLWQAAVRAPFWLRNPALSLLTIALPADLALTLLRHRLASPGWLLPALLIAVPVAVFMLHWGITRTNGKLALATVFTLMIALYCGMYSYKTHCLDRYEDDTAFLQQTRAMVPHEATLLVNYDAHALEAFRALFYLDTNASLLHNFSYLLDDRIRQDEVYVLARGHNIAELSRYGTAHPVLQSKHTRGEASPGDRWTLFLLHFRNDLVRRPANLYICPMQASGRATGPFLE
jgi:4-amino-4-deoxy-L-arabinose transferase-like glycosyltransferase